MSSIPVAEEDLHGFVDNEMDDDKREAILAYLAKSSSDAARVETWRQQNILLRAVFSQVTLEQVPASLAVGLAPRLIPIPCLTTAESPSRQVPHQLRQRSLAFIVAAFVAGVSIALAANFSMRRYSEFVRGEFADAASSRGSALALLATAALQHLPSAETIPSFALNTPGALAPALVILPALERQGLRLRQGEITGEPDSPASCLDFTDTSGTRVVLCIAAAQMPANPALQGLAVVSAHAVYWQEAASFYALAASFSNDRLLDLARHIHAALTSQRKP